MRIQEAFFIGAKTEGTSLHKVDREGRDHLLLLFGAHGRVEITILGAIGAKLGVVSTVQHLIFCIRWEVFHSVLDFLWCGDPIKTASNGKNRDRNVRDVVVGIRVRCPQYHPRNLGGALHLIQETNGHGTTHGMPTNKPMIDISGHHIVAPVDTCNGEISGHRYDNHLHSQNRHSARNWCVGTGVNLCTRVEDQSSHRIAYRGCKGYPFPLCYKLC